MSDKLSFTEAKEAMRLVMDLEAVIPRLGLSTSGAASIKRIKSELTIQLAEAVVREDLDCR